VFDLRYVICLQNLGDKHGNYAYPRTMANHHKAKDKLKILYWDKTGFALWQKRLEKQKFKWPSKIKEHEFSLTAEQLHWLLSGYDVLGHQELYYQSMI